MKINIVDKINNYMYNKNNMEVNKTDLLTCKLRNSINRLERIVGELNDIAWEGEIQLTKLNSTPLDIAITEIERKIDVLKEEIIKKSKK